MPDGAPATPQITDNPDPADENPPATPADFEFDGEFDEERAKRKIAALAADKKAQQTRAQALEAEKAELAAKVAAYEAEKLTDAERKDAELAAARAELAQTRRTTALIQHGLPESALVFLTAESAEDIAAQAAALASLHATSQPAAPAPDLHTTPTPDLTPSAGQQIPPTDPPFDPVALARRARAGH